MTSRAFCRKSEPTELMRPHRSTRGDHQRQQDGVEREQHLDETFERSGAAILCASCGGCLTHAPHLLPEPPRSSCFERRMSCVISELSMSSSCVPMLAMRPPSMTMMRSASCTLVMRCAMMSLVVSGRYSARPARILASVLVSTALVEVVENQDLGAAEQGARNAEALLLTAGDVGAPLLDPCVVALGEAVDELVGAGQVCRPLRTSSSVASGSPQRRLSAMVPLKSTFFCRTMAT